MSELDISAIEARAVTVKLYLKVVTPCGNMLEQLFGCVADVPALVARVRELEAENEQLKIATGELAVCEICTCVGDPEDMIEAGRGDGFNCMACDQEERLLEADNE